jgi:hypothetical protein
MQTRSGQQPHVAALLSLCVDVRTGGGDTGTGRSVPALRAAARRNGETAERVQRLRANLVRLDLALGAWDAWEDEQRRPPAERRGLVPPLVEREVLVLLHAAASAYLREFEARGW